MPRPDDSALYNARFEFGSEAFPVVVQKFSYSWKTALSGSSQSRQRYVVYPKRVERTALSVTLIFRDMDEYIAFGEFMRRCHLGLTASNNPYDLFFISPTIRSWTSWYEDGREQYGVKYSVVIKSVPLNVTVDTVAPTMNLTMDIIVDMLEKALDGVTAPGYAESGSYEVRDIDGKLHTHNISTTPPQSSAVESASTVSDADSIFRTSRGKTAANSKTTHGASTL